MPTRGEGKMGGEKKSFLLYRDYAGQFALLADEEAGQVIKALFCYENGETAPVLSGAARMLYAGICRDLDRNRDRYEEVCRRNRENGKQGGRPKKAKPENASQEDGKKRGNSKNAAVAAHGALSEKSEGLFQKPKKPDKDTDKGMDKDTETETEKGTDTNLLSSKEESRQKDASPAGEGARAFSEEGHSGVVCASEQTEVGSKAVPFEAFWQSYPKKQGRGAARSQWAKLRPDTVLWARMEQTLNRFRKSDQWKEQGGRFIPAPATWLREERWEDVLPESISSSISVQEREALFTLPPEKQGRWYE